MITIRLLKKEKGRIYKSVDIVRSLFGLELEHDEEGAPLVRKGVENGQQPQDPVFISISDTKNYWACALSDHLIGIDIEELSRKVRPAMVRKFHKEEQDYLAVLSEGSREWNEEFFSVWTRKEAYSKYRQKGLSIGFSRFSVLSGSVDGVPLGYFTRRGLMFGFAGDDQAEVIDQAYEAPMELAALDYAAGLLDVRAYSSAEITEKLKARGYNASEISAALEKLKDYGYVNDKAYAEGLARRAAESGKGLRRIEAELRQKGLDKSLAWEAAAEHKEGEYERALEIARMLAEKDAASKAGKMTAGAADPDADTRADYALRQKLAAKISRKLSQLGYEAGIIYSVLEDVIK